jgi:transposase
MESKRVRRRRHSPEFRAQVIAACAEPGASVADVAQQHGLNVTLVHNWRRAQLLGADGQRVAENVQGEFIALPVPTACTAAASDIRVEVRRGALAVTVTWPAATAGQCSAWLSQWLK